ncbi:MAG: glycosyltransferase family 4 protein [Vulcanimicrobiaceae bacterium]
MIDLALDVRRSSHMSLGMIAYVRELAVRLPQVAPDLRLATFGRGDNFGFAEQLAMPLWIARHRPRLVHVPSPYVPLWCPAPFVVTVHDLIELRFPEYAKPTVGPYFRWLVAPALRRAAAVLTDDPRTAGDLVSLLRTPRERIRIVPLGVDDAFLDAPPAEPREPPYLLYVGNRRPHKDLPTLLRAWRALPAELALDLHLSGDAAPAFAPYARDDARIVSLGELGRAELIEAYRGATLYVHPSRYEGFGLPLLEASVLGVPAIATPSGVPQPLQAAVATFPPGDDAALAALIAHLLEDRVALCARGRAARSVARAYSWDRCARATAAVYRELLVR